MFSRYVDKLARFNQYFLYDLNRLATKWKMLLFKVFVKVIDVFPASIQEPNVQVKTRIIC
ncbi:hypothetical protein ACH2FV_12105 [Bacillus safensis subsp. safensis]|uniref:hypothetical protein n=1 Tax=Bacillus safensis TaxID=561879 RepID=UPI0037C174FB